MRWLAVAILTLAVSAAQASDLLKMFVPSPATVVITVGRWIYEQHRQDPVYEITVQGSGQTEQEAREQAFRLAVNEAIGSLVLSQTEVVNQEVARNIVINYSSGYVQRFQLLGSSQLDDGRLAMRYRVWVKRSTLANGLFGDSRSGNTVEGQQVAQSLRSLEHEQRQGDALLESVLRNFPAKAFDIGTPRAQFRLDNQRRPSMWVEFDLVWHRPWVDSLGQVLSQTSQISSRDPCAQYSVSCSDRTYYAQIALAPGASRIQQQGIYRDEARWLLIKQHLLDTWPVLRIQLRDHSGSIQHDGCYSNWQLNPVAAGASDRYSSGAVTLGHPNRIVVEAWQRARFSIRIAQPLTADQLDQVQKIDIAVVPRRDCLVPPTFAP